MSTQGQHLSPQTKAKLSLIFKGRSRPELQGIPLKPEHRRKLRVAEIAYIDRTRGFLCFGKNETRLLDEQEKIDNCKIQRQFRVKELGYFVDGYDPISNTVYEVYEKRHDQKKRHERDLRRQREIEEALNCKFKIIRDF